MAVFQHFSGDGHKISAIEFFKLCKLCKIYPVVITFEDLKKIVLKNKEFWLLHQKYEGLGPTQQRLGGDSEVELPEPSPDNSFPFDEFVNAFRVSTDFQFEFVLSFHISFDRSLDGLAMRRPARAMARRSSW